MHPWEGHKAFIADRIRLLIEQKHLFQSVSLQFQDWTDYWQAKPVKPNEPIPIGITASRNGPNYSKEDLIQREFNHYSSMSWHLIPEEKEFKGLVAIESEKIEVPLWHVRIPCSHCTAERPPHVSGYPNFSEPFIHFSLPGSLKVEKPLIQVFSVPYQCQSCRGEPIVFQMKRTFQKVQLVGRSIFEKVEVPSYIPKPERKWIEQAIISSNCGHHLASYFYLRVFIEQHFRRILGRNGRVDIDQLGEEYNKTIPAPIQSSIPSLPKTYENLSSFVHQALDEDSEFSTQLT